MRIRCAVVVAAWLLSSAADTRAAGLQCATGPENDRRVAALHARPRERVRIAANAEAGLTVRNGAIYLPANEEVAPGYHPFDLEGRSLVFRPGTGGGYTVARESLRYVEPVAAGRLLGAPITADLGFTFSAFGRSVQRVYVSPFLGITFEEPGDDLAVGLSEVEALVRPTPLISPLMQTALSLKPLPVVHVDRTPSSLIVTWRSATHQWFGYDVQAELHEDGVIVFSYQSLRNLRWGTPVIAAGGAAGALPRQTIFEAEIPAGTTTPVDPSLAGMLDLRRVELSRIAGSEVFSIRMTTAAPIDRSKLPSGQSLTYHFILGSQFATIIVRRADITVSGFHAFTPETDGVTGRVEGNTVEIFGLQPAPGTPRTELLNVVTFLGVSRRAADVGLYPEVSLDAAPRRLAVDLSAAADGSELALPIVEPFLLPSLDPYAVWEQLQAAYGFSDEEIDAVAIYQTFFTDLILYATAYATGGNPQVDGIHPPGQNGRGTTLPRIPSLMHMNQVSFDENADEKIASVVMLHEFGHRWLYRLQFLDDVSASAVLSPAGFHPAAYVDTRSAFPLYGPAESSVMGGGHFTNIGGNRYRARSLRYGYSWTDLYLMGLASPEEVEPWFYLSGTKPALPLAYFPEDGIEVTGTKRNVTLPQVTAVQGPRNPTPATSPHTFRVLFVLVTDPGTEPTAAEIAKIDWLRAKMEHDFLVTTGGRGHVTTDRPAPKKRRSVR